uniref:Venom serpin 1 n=1 Tax=Ectomocoris sp. TaxID=3104572 RepID=A0AB38ZE72_9HEMI
MESIKTTAMIFFGCLLIFAMPATTYDVKDLERLAEGNNKFSMDVYQKLKKPNENLVVSPISIQLVLALVYAGAKGNTAKEIANALHLPENLDEVLKGHKMLLEQLQHPTLKIASKSFIEKTFNVKPEFQELASKYFLSDAGLMNFIGDPEGSRKEINKWVQEKTNDKIKDLLKEGTIDALTRLVLTNAIHFKANWASKFNEALTIDDDFYVTPENKVKVKMMVKKEKFPFRMHQELDAKILELPYEDKEFKMIIILPNKIDGLPEVENKLSKMNLVEEMSKLHEVTVNVKLPRFKIENTHDLADTLIALGIKDLFSEADANLSGISDERLSASKAIQKAFIEVNEEGTEAAAATATLVESRSLLVAFEKQFEVNRPFIYLISKKLTPIFIGSIRKF